MLRRVAATTPPNTEVVATLETATAAGPEERILAETALEGWERLVADDELTDAHADALEAIVLPLQRPVFDVLNDSFHAPPPPWAGLAEHRAAIETAIRAVGRVEIVGHPSVPYGGTGILVASNLILTNRHVAELFTEGLGQRQLRFHTGLRTAIDFKQEILPADPILLDLVEPLLVHPYWDAALLRVEGIDGSRTPLRLAGSEPQVLDGRTVIVLGYPAMDPRNDLPLQFKIFRGVFQRKRLQPGTLMGYQSAESYDRDVEALAHDCSTLGGNSGSAVVDVATGQVLGLHFGGAYLEANWAVPAWELAADTRVVDLGVGVDTPAATAAERPWLRYWDSADPEEAPTAAATAPAPATVAGRPATLFGGDWYERVTDEGLADALRRDDEATLAQLAEELGPTEARDIARTLTRAARLAAEPPGATPPEVVFLHGFLGAHLDERGGARARVWLSPEELVGGELAGRLLLDDAQARVVDAAGHLRAKYALAARSWESAGLVVHRFSYDWRRPVEQAADRLHLFIESLCLDRPDRQFALIAHSTGGLVAAAYARRHPVWADRVLRAVFMGVPLGGSYAPVEAVTGGHPLLRKLAWLTERNDLDDLRRAAASMPGLMDMLPDPNRFPDAAPLYARDAWPGEVAPGQRSLDRSRNLKPAVLASPLLERTTQLLSVSHGTVASLADDGELAGGPRTAPGDGTVPARSAAVDCLPCFAVDRRHEDIPADPKAIDATLDLVTTGACRLDPIRPGDLTGDAVLPERPTPELPEGAQAGIRTRLATGRLRHGDVDWLLASDFSELPEA
jgi:pimeloyl-ACP methyl ester carboxylesterase